MSGIHPTELLKLQSVCSNATIMVICNCCNFPAPIPVTCHTCIYRIWCKQRVYYCTTTTVAARGDYWRWLGCWDAKMKATNVGHLIIICTDDDVFHRHHLYHYHCIVIKKTEATEQQQKLKTCSERLQMHQRARAASHSQVSPDTRYAPWLAEWRTKISLKVTVIHKSFTFDFYIHL